MGGGASAARGENKDGVAPLGWKVTHTTERTLMCRFCGGDSCKREDWTKQDV